MIDDLKCAVEKCIDEKKGTDITTIPLGNFHPLAKYIIVASGTSKRHISAMADHLSLLVKTNYNLPVYMEGMNNSDWVVLDIGDIIVHLFHPEARNNFRIEQIFTKKQIVL